ncbi:hypothetical protein [Kaistella sp.]|uniref:hypothetical protein n=1 Tax=Kaistella sp. TaxID=2782235 RepID=UPI003C38EDB1
MKKLLLVATFAVAGVTGSLSAKSTVGSSPTSVKSVKIAGTICVKKMKDLFGNVYYVQVTCPPVVVVP